jgi:hypothetical protein
VIAAWSDNEFAAIFAEQLAQLRIEIEQAFPNAPLLHQAGTG